MEITRINELITLLETEEVAVSFITKKGIARTMVCTRDLTRVPDDVKDGINDPKLNGDKIVAVYDFDNSAWRSFRKDAVTHFKRNMRVFEYD